MGIKYFEDEKVFKLDSKDASYVIALVDEEQFAGHAYYGKKISNPKDFIGLRTLTPSEMGEENPLYSARGGKNYIETVWGRGYVLRDPDEPKK